MTKTDDEDDNDTDNDHYYDDDGSPVARATSRLPRCASSSTSHHFPTPSTPPPPTPTPTPSTTPDSRVPHGPHGNISVAPAAVSAEATAPPCQVATSAKSSGQARGGAREEGSASGIFNPQPPFSLSCCVPALRPTFFFRWHRVTQSCSALLSLTVQCRALRSSAPLRGTQQRGRGAGEPQPCAPLDSGAAPLLSRRRCRLRLRRLLLLGSCAHSGGTSRDTRSQPDGRQGGPVDGSPRRRESGRRERTWRPARSMDSDSGELSEGETVSAAGPDLFSSKNLALQAQKKILSKLASKTVANMLIDDTSSEIFDELYKVTKEHTRNKKEAHKIMKDLIKVAIKIGILYRNNQFNQEEMEIVEKLRKKLNQTAMTMVSFYEVEYTFDKNVLSQLLNECKDLLHELVGRHLTPRTHGRINHVFNHFADVEFLSSLYSLDGECRPNLKKICDGVNKLLEEKIL
ncbi:tumor necrosis factor alpha-induced protein 8-like protein 3 [Dromiciops gliroides]|uniref:tumor necrosis factor alpha-induced protein 8-like protein 3 n=1 Tax=Dromiciops gliroides TaxID=33562 RepID=UPI001CC66D80|nr:tumor necrosis factor alpha-induced protein 8-like protein 3 [Dromiciops gliroides]